MRYSLLFFAGLFTMFTTHAQLSATATIEVDVDTTTPFLEQAVRYTIRLYSVDDLGERARFVPPRFDTLGQSAVVDTAQTTQVRDGQMVRVVSQTYTLYPLQAGSVVIEPFRIEVEETPFEAGLVVESRPVILNVRARPATQAEGYTNAVGQFDVVLEVDQPEVQVGNFLSLWLRVQGAGNFERLLPPDLTAYFDALIVDTTTRDNLAAPDRGMRSFQYLLLVEEAGTLDIPSIPFVFLNPQDERFETRRTAPLSVIVNPSPERLSDTDEMQQPLIGRRDLPLKSPAPSPLVDLIVPIWLWPVPPLLAALVWLMTRHTRSAPRIAPARRPSRRRSNDLKIAQRELASASGDHPRDRYRAIESALLNYLNARSSEPVALESLEAVRWHLPNRTYQRLVQLLQEASTGYYAPITSDDADLLLKRADQLLSLIDSQWKSS